MADSSVPPPSYLTLHVNKAGVSRLVATLLAFTYRSKKVGGCIDVIHWFDTCKDQPALPLEFAKDRF